MARKNYKIKSAFTEIEYTADKILELQKCITDPVYFIKNYIKIKHPSRGQIKFDLYPYQEDMVRRFKLHPRVIACLSRQVGKSELSAAYMLWYAIVNPVSTILIASNKETNAMEIIGKIEHAYQELPDWLKPGIDDKNYNKKSLTFDNGSRILCTATAANSGRGLTISLLYLDEYSFVQENIQEDFWTSIWPTISVSGRIIITSTPSGDSNKFAELWRGAELGTNSFHPISVPWNAPPGRDENFKKEQISILGEIKWRQEFLCEFISSDTTLFNTEIITKNEKDIKGLEPEMRIPDPINQPFFKKLNRSGTYIVGVDPATGSGNDYSAIEVLEFPSLKQVFEFRSNQMSQPEIYNFIKNMLTFISAHSKELYWGVENNGVGHGIIALYQNDTNVPPGDFISEEKDKLGFFTTAKNKIPACLLMKNLYETKQMTLFSEIILKEMKNYKRKAGSYEAKTGSTDDCISAILICLKIIKHLAQWDEKAYHLLYTNNIDAEGGTAWLQAAYGTNQQEETELMPFIMRRNDELDIDFNAEDIKLTNYGL